MSFFDGVLTPMDIIVVNRQFCEQLDEEKQKMFYELLENTMMKMEGDKTIRADIEKFLRENITTI